MFDSSTFRMRCALLIILGSSTHAFGQWPQWGGPKRDFKSETTGLATTWPEDGPKRIWSRPLGDGVSSLAFDDGRLFTLYRDGEEEVVVALDGASGRTVWESRYPAPVPEGVETRFGVGPRSTPTVAGGRVYTLGVAGMLRCTRASDGQTVWSHDLMKEFGAKSPEFGFASSPTVYKETLITAVGGAGCGMMAFDLANGSVVWKRYDFENIYSSPLIIHVDGQDQAVLLVDREVVAVHPASGEMYWRREHVNQWKTNISTPVWGGDRRLFATSGGDAGSRVWKLAHKGDQTYLKEIWADRKASVGQGNVVRIGDHYYGCAGYGPNSFLAAVHAGTGEIAWQERGFAKGTIVYADGKLIVLDAEGTLTLAKASPERFERMSSFKLFDLGENRESWTLPILVGTRLFARDNDTVVALDLG